MTAIALLVAVTAAFVGLDGIGRGSALRAAVGAVPAGAVAAGPVLLLGHVWLVAAAGLLVGLFPRWEAAVVSSAYWWVLAIAAGLVLRVAAIGTAAFDSRRTPGTAHVALSATGALATAVGAGGFLGVAAGVAPVIGAVAVVALDLVLSGWWLGAPTPRWAPAVAGALLCVPAAVLVAGGAVVGGLVVATTAAAGVLAALVPAHRVAGVLLTLAAVVPLAARWPELAVPGAGARPAVELATGPVGAALVTGVAGPVFGLVLLVQIWFWGGPARRGSGGGRADAVRG